MLLGRCRDLDVHVFLMVLMVGALSNERERGGVVPYSFSLHRESDLSRRPSTVHFPFDAVLARTL